jgi:alkyldihydroxyacetonephosphate synthase
MTEWEITAVAVAVAVAVILAVALLSKRRRSGSEPDAFFDHSEGERFPHKWGYTDTRFEFVDDRTVRVSGSRYPISGYEMPFLVAFVEDVLGIAIRREDSYAEREDIGAPEPNVEAAFGNAVKERFRDAQVSFDPKVRLVHSHGQLSVEEVYRVMYGDSVPRLVDLVFYPEEEADVKAMIELANEHNVCLVPYGGGTNVSGALACPTEERRTIVSVDMRRMKRVQWIDEANLQACVEAGISGKGLEQVLGERGYTSGHDPDSVELSTMGGWISTNASGMKKNRYGNIEDIVLEATLVTPTGEIATRRVTPRNSTGVQPRGLLFGSEGNFGIITTAVIKIHPIPEARKYGALVFPAFEKGVAYLKALRQTGMLPASIRLVNNNEFRFGQALKPEPTSLKGVKERIQKFVLLKVLGFDPMKMAACTIVMEGTHAEVRQQERTIFSLAKEYGARSAGASNGRRGYSLTFGIAYIRDFLNQYGILGETFETSVPWDRIHQVCDAVSEELVTQAARHEVPGKPYLSYRVTQTYHTGVCIYFTMGICGKGMEQPGRTFHAIEHHLRQVILDNGGSLSHHHGVGKVRREFLTQIQTDTSIQVMRQAKNAMDPKNIFGIGNGVFGGTD